MTTQQILEIVDGPPASLLADSWSIKVVAVPITFIFPENHQDIFLVTGLIWIKRDEQVFVICENFEGKKVFANYNVKTRKGELYFEENENVRD